MTGTTDDGIWRTDADITWIDSEKPMVAFTFDDGPVGIGEDSCAIRIQDALAKAGQHATFFYWGLSLKGNEEEIKRAQELGFEIGNHTRNHKKLTTLPDEEIKEEIESMRKALEDLTGQKEFLIRAPYLDYNERVGHIAGVPFANCGLDTKDWAGVSTEDIKKTIMNACENSQLQNRIILMHETYTTTAEAVEFLVPWLKERNYQIVSVSEMFAANGVAMYDGHIYDECK